MSYRQAVRALLLRTLSRRVGQTPTVFLSFVGLECRKSRYWIYFSCCPATQRGPCLSLSMRGWCWQELNRLLMLAEARSRILY